MIDLCAALLLGTFLAILMAEAIDGVKLLISRVRPKAR
jgi:hypothetical protein